MDDCGVISVALSMPPDSPDLQLVSFPSRGGPIQFTMRDGEETIWGTRHEIAELFGCTEDNVRKHIRKVYEDKELDENRTSEKTSEVQLEGERSVARQIERYNLDVMLSVGYRVSTGKATEFRQWATKTLREVMTKGFVLDEERLASDLGLQEELAAKLRHIRLDERNLYAKVRDVFAASATDYDGNSQPARTFFAMAQDKFIYAITEKTAAQIILDRADGSKVNMGLRTIKGEQPTADEAKTGKNYLTEAELRSMENICEQFMLFAESKAFRRQKMTMEELTEKLNTLLRANDYPVLYKYEKYQRQQADALARQQLERYRARIGPAKAVKQVAPSVKGIAGGSVSPKPKGSK
jgi:hypothetical protein